MNGQRKASDVIFFNDKLSFNFIQGRNWTQPQKVKLINPVVSQDQTKFDKKVQTQLVVKFIILGITILISTFSIFVRCQGF